MAVINSYGKYKIWFITASYRYRKLISCNYRKLINFSLNVQKYNLSKYIMYMHHHIYIKF